MGVIVTRHTGTGSSSTSGGSGVYTLTEKQNMELEMAFKAATLCYYKEFTYDDTTKLLTNLGIWSTPSKLVKLFNKDFVYDTQKLLIRTTLSRISPSAQLISSFGYNTAKNLISITRTGTESGCSASSSSSSSSVSSSLSVSSSSSSSSLSVSSSSSSESIVARITVGGDVRVTVGGDTRIGI